MADAAKKKVDTAVRQARHALANVEEAAELQAEEVIERIVESKPVRTIETNKVAVISGTTFAVGTVAGVYVHRLVEKRKARKWDKAEKKVETLVKVEEMAQEIRDFYNSTSSRDRRRFQMEIGKMANAKRAELGRDLDASERVAVIDEVFAAFERLDPKK